jgi:nitrite reductase/ring-hydroxylating ferredoxin subunit
VSASEQSTTRLIAVAELGDSQVAVVEETPHGVLAVGISVGKPFAVSNRCRHLFASLGKGRVTGEGCLECPSHAALYDVGTGEMVRGPQGAFKPLAGAVKATTGARALKGRGARRRYLAGWLSDGHVRAGRAPPSRKFSYGLRRRIATSRLRPTPRSSQRGRRLPRR